MTTMRPVKSNGCKVYRLLAVTACGPQALPNGKHFFTTIPHHK